MSTPSAIRIFARPTPAKRFERWVFQLLRLSTYFVLACAAVIFIDIGWKGGAVIFQTRAPFINVPFLTEAPETLNVFEWHGEKRTMGDRAFRQFRKEHEAELKGGHVETYVYSAGGIYPNIVGTVLLVTGSILIALVLGVLSAIYLSEYALDGPFIRFLRLSIVNLAGVPSIVFGLFGFGMFVIALDFGVSLLAGWLTLAFMVLPIIITAAEEALKAVPKGYREGSLALGATKLQAIMTNVLPYALPGILTSSVLSIARVAGETAPIMFTAAFVVRDELPWQVKKWTEFIYQGVMALPYHIYVVASKIPQNEYTRDVQYGTAFVFLFTVAAIAMVAVILRVRLRKKVPMVSTTLSMFEAPPAPTTRPVAVPPAAVPSGPPDRAVIEIDDVDFCYGAATALHDITLKISERQVTAFIGPSGCGKSTLLRCLNRMNDLVDGSRISKGQIRIDGVNIYDSRVDVIELRKRVGMVFQKSNPFPKSIYDNITYGLRIQGERRKARLDEMVERSLRGAALWDEVKDRLGESALGMSGGQQQRLCIARAIAVEPEIILMDEPCSALDPIATAKVEELIHDLKRQYTIVIVTHNMQQAARVSDRTAFFYLGRLIEYAETRTIFMNPGNPQTEAYVSGRFG